MTVPAGILGVGTALPPHTCSQTDALELAIRSRASDRRQERLLRMLFTRSGVERRYGVLPVEMYWGSDGSGRSGERTTAERMRQYAEHAPILACSAAARALTDAAVEADSITHLVTVSCTGFDAPGVDVELIRRLGLSPTTERVHVGYMGCHGAVNGLRVARGLLAAEPAARVLLCAVELCTLHFQKEWHDERIVGDALFADGAAAVVLGSDREDRAALAGRPALAVRDTASCLLPDSHDAMAWRIGDHGFEMKLTTAIAGHVEMHLKPWLEAWLDRCGLASSDVQRWIVHPGGPRIVDTVQAALGLPDEACASSRRVLAECGNMSSPTVLFILERELRAHAAGPCVMLAFGPGLTAEAALLV